MINANSRRYNLRHEPVVGICLDGCDPAYLEAAAASMPNLRTMIEKGCMGRVQTVVPSFTNPNNVAIVTGTPPAVNGICGNYYFDEISRLEVPMDDPRFLTATSVLAAFAADGGRVAAVTTKDKLLRLLGEGLDGLCFSVEKATEAAAADPAIARILARIGRPVPGIYDPAASLFCVEAGLQLLASGPVDLLYLSTTDYVQHKYGPDDPQAVDFYSELDGLLGQLDECGAVVGITGDHGMNAKVTAGDAPNVRYLETELLQGGIRAPRVILPITDAHVVHHGALGSYATIYVEPDQIEPAKASLESLQGVELVLSRSAAATRFDLPADRIGDLVVLGDRDTVLGRTPEWHDLSEVSSGLRSHGGLHEAVVPLIVNRPLQPDHRRRLEAGTAHNYDLFDFLCNGIDA